MSSDTFPLARLGWRAAYAQQLRLEELHDAFPARVAAVQRGVLSVLAESGEHRVTLPQRLRPEGEPIDITVGDWVLVQSGSLQVQRRLARQSVIARLSAGTAPVRQLIAANLDTLFVVSSCNADFNPSRLERYLAVAHEAQVTPVIVLTKIDTCPEPQPYFAAAESLARGIAVAGVDGRNAVNTFATLGPWLGQGQTVAFVGSSGVGKSTLINSLIGTVQQDTRAARAGDDKGRHTTTARYLLPAPGGCWLIDTPGMRELKIGAAAQGVARTFEDLDTLAAQCQFRDCRHLQEKGCALRAAVSAGHLELRRLESYLKLLRESARAAAPPWQRRQQNRQAGRLARTAQQRRRRDTGRED